ncbi:aminodeoxychorismate synthase component I [Roseibium sp.]|uniref:aminodeoxychorismate synthase component I n=1 Tax=Roseibium sp. TaxID=1936156 RepID=UPI003A96ED6B
MTSSGLEVGSVLLLDCLNEKRARLFEAPRRIIECRHIDGVRECLEKAEAEQCGGSFVAGFLAYELGFAFEPKLTKLWQHDGELLAWFGVYDRPRELPLDEARELLAGTAGSHPAGLSSADFEWQSERYDDAFRQVQRHLAAGDIYQVNLTMRAHYTHHGAAESNFLQLLEQQPVAYAAFLKLERQSILSLSPELFLQRTGDSLRTKPMKGTAPRGRTPDEDRMIAAALAKDPKQLAENTMIVDLMRNDLSRIARTGSVEVSGLCEVERYKSLHQMVSTVEADLLPHVGFAGIIESLFPCGSITGAPKLSAMTIAHRLESSPRGVYTGSIGVLEPSGDFCFNVAIRTLVLRDDGTGIVGAGSGVVYDSAASPEYDECRLKLNFMTGAQEHFDLFETMAFHPDEGFVLLERHLQRLKESAAYFGFSFDLEATRALLSRHSESYATSKRVRCVLSSQGSLSVTETDLPPSQPQSAWKVALAKETTSAKDRFLYHKTTRREFYDDARERYAALTGCQEVIFANEDGFLTEGSFTNLFLQRNGQLVTPALQHGLLPGTLRAGLLEHGLAYEGDLSIGDLRDAEAIYLGNSVRGLIPVEILH